MGQYKDPKKLKARCVKNEQEARRREQRLRERERRAKYPEFVMVTGEADPAFVEIVHDAVKEIDFDDQSIFTDAERTYYREMRRNGIQGARLMATQAIKKLSLPAEWLCQYGIEIEMKYGTALYQYIEEEKRREYLPYNDVQVVPIDRRFELRFSSLRSEKGAGGRIYYGHREPKVTYNGQEYVAAFSRHAIERICERINPRFLEYAAAGEIHSIFATCVFYESVKLPNSEPAFGVLAECGDSRYQAYATYVEGVLGEANVVIGGGNRYFRLGYCPVVLEGRFAKAKTFLHPGYTGTPEYELLAGTAIPKEMRAQLLTQTRDMTSDDIAAGNGLDAIRWFHENGVPQVLQMKHKVYEPLGT